MKLKNKDVCHHILGHSDNSLAPGEVSKELADDFLESHPGSKFLLASGKLELLEEKKEPAKAKAKAKE